MTAPAATGVASARTRAPNRSPDEVRALLVDATVALLSEGPPAGVTVRAIADRAGVQHSLITRHFASKDQLVAAALSELAGEYTRIVDGASDPVDGYLRVLDHLRANPTAAVALTAGASAREGDSPEARFPGYAAHLAQIVATGAADDDRTRLVAGVALVAGWSVLEANLVTAGGLDDLEPSVVRDEVAGIIARLIARETEPRAGERAPGASSTTRGRRAGTDVTRRTTRSVDEGSRT